MTMLKPQERWIVEVRNHRREIIKRRYFDSADDAMVGYQRLKNLDRDVPVEVSVRRTDVRLPRS